MERLGGLSIFESAVRLINGATENTVLLLTSLCWLAICGKDPNKFSECSDLGGISYRKGKSEPVSKADHNEFQSCGVITVRYFYEPG